LVWDDANFYTLSISRNFNGGDLDAFLRGEGCHIFRCFSCDLPPPPDLPFASVGGGERRAVTFPNCAEHSYLSQVVQNRSEVIHVESFRTSWFHSIWWDCFGFSGLSGRRISADILSQSHGISMDSLHHSDNLRPHSISRRFESIPGCRNFNGWVSNSSEAKPQVHFARCLFNSTRDYESRGKAPSSMTPCGTNPKSWRPLKEDSRHKPGKNVGIPQVGDVGDRATHNATIVRDHPSRILREFQWCGMREILRALGPEFQRGNFESFDYLGAQSGTIEIHQGRKGTEFRQDHSVWR
jgi:hypothetical protein